MQAVNPYARPMDDCLETALDMVASIMQRGHGYNSLDFLENAAIYHATANFACVYAVCAFLWWACNQPEVT